MITVKMDVNQCYQVVLETVKDAFFPNSVNPAVGDIGFFHGFEIVNGHNDNVCDGISDFTLSRYIEKKMVSGSVRLHLLMAEEASLPDDQNGDEHKDDPDYLPDLPCLRNGSHNGTLYVAASPSGKVLIKENLLIVWSLKMKSRCYPEKNGIKLVLVSNEAEFLVEQHSQNPQKSSLGNLFYECLNICLSASFKASLVTIVQAEM